MLHEKWGREDEMKDLVETIFAIVDPRRFKRYRDNKERIKKEQLGFERINYQGEGDYSWHELSKDFEGFDLSVLGLGSAHINPTGEGLGKVLRENGHHNG